MSKTIKRVLAALLIIIGGVVLVQMTEDRFIRMFIIACIVFFATYLNKRTLKRQKLAELHAKLEEELDEEERLANEQSEASLEDSVDANEESLEESEEDTNIDTEEPK